jgi:hypothetical protein
MTEKPPKPKILILANDAGGAQLIRSLIVAEKNSAQWTVVTLKGSPASRIFEKVTHLSHLNFRDSQHFLESYHEKVDLLVFNPGWNPFPQEVIGRNEGISCPTLALLDHWIDYDKRLENCMADYFVVCDEDAFEAAANSSLSPVLKLNNYHLMELEKKARSQVSSTATGGPLLYVSQTIKLHEQAKNPSFTEFTYLGRDEGKVIKDILINFDGLRKCFGITKIRFRLHPSEFTFRHREVMQKFPAISYEVEEASDRRLAESVLDSALVLGINSMALFEAHLLDRPSFAIRPHPSTILTIPLPENQKVGSAREIKKANLGGEKRGYYRESPIESLFPLVLPSDK